MKFFPDTANLDELKKDAGWGILDGVTTHPSWTAKPGRLESFLKDPGKVFKETPVSG